MNKYGRQRRQVSSSRRVSYIIDPNVQGQVTARTSRPIPRAAVIPALENILAMEA